MGYPELGYPWVGLGWVGLGCDFKILGWRQAKSGLALVAGDDHYPSCQQLKTSDEARGPAIALL